MIVLTASFAWLGELPDGAPGATGLAITQQTKRWVILIHPGALSVYRAVGNWSDVDEDYNNKLLARQKVLVDAWSAFNKTNPPDEAQAFTTAWLVVRTAALQKAGLDVIFD